MQPLNFNGPYKLQGENSVFNNIPDKKQGIYLLCIKNDENLFRVYYVGESINIRNRLNSHMKDQLSGKATAHDPHMLKHNVLLLTHRANQGLVPRLSKMNPVDVNQDFVNELYVFVAELADGEKDDKSRRCRYERGIVEEIENGGQNILWVGSTRLWKGEPEYIEIFTADVEIEYLTGSKIKI